jgi:DNA-3-methyladenine glycosylase
LTVSVLPINFYLGKDTAAIARDLLGKVLVHETSEGFTSGVIWETEAYLAHGDPASHSFRGATRRNQPMFGPPGSSYIYISYGIHHCFNIVCQPEGVPEAVLVRAVQPLTGIDLIKRRRGQVTDKQLTNGPGKLCQALAIDLSLNGHPLQQPPLYILDGPAPGRVEATPRIGISVGQELPLRFLAKHK